MTSYAKILRPVDGIQIIEETTTQFGVATLEGRIGPLLQGVGSQAHYIEMPADLFTPEHSHPTESIIYTIFGNWVLCSGGQRHLMRPGSLFWFGPNISTGYETPFGEPAFLLIFKSSRSGGEPESPDNFVDYLENTLRPRLLAEQANGEIFRFDDLPDDHPARLFARSHQPSARN